MIFRRPHQSTVSRVLVVVVLVDRSSQRHGRCGFLLADLTLVITLDRPRRFGENDQSLELEEKMWARMQRERHKRSRSGHMYHLDNDSKASDFLTHKGEAIGEDYNDAGAAFDDMGGGSASGDDDLDAEVVNRLHFGGQAGDSSRSGQVSCALAAFVRATAHRSIERTLRWHHLYIVLAIKSPFPKLYHAMSSRGEGALKTGKTIFIVRSVQLRVAV